MSESEKVGRCRSELAVHEMYGVKHPESLKALADAIDRLAADVAAVKEMTQEIALRVPSEFGQDACDVAVRVALNERDKLRAEVERLRMQLAACGVLADCNTTDSLERNRRMHPDYDCASVQSVIRAVEREIRLRTEVETLERLVEELEDQQPPAAPQPAGHGISPGLPETQSAGNAAPPAGWLTEEERRILSAHVRSLRDQRRAMERGGQTLGYSANPCAIKREADVIDALLARAGSPPVVEVPDLPSNHYARSEAERYRVAIDKAGVAWREVGRE